MFKYCHEGFFTLDGLCNVSSSSNYKLWSLDVVFVACEVLQFKHENLASYGAKNVLIEGKFRWKIRAPFG